MAFVPSPVHGSEEYNDYCLDCTNFTHSCFMLSVKMSTQRKRQMMSQYYYENDVNEPPWVHVNNHANSQESWRYSDFVLQHQIGQGWYSSNDGWGKSIQGFPQVSTTSTQIKCQDQELTGTAMAPSCLFLGNFSSMSSSQHSRCPGLPAA